MQQYIEALRLQPNFAEAYNNLGATLANRGRVTEAISHYTAALRLQPNYIKARLNLGVLFARQGQFVEAREQFAEVLRLDPTHTAARQFLDGLPPEGNAMGTPNPNARP
jgi:tetratricopeptide (TPR) repeat protein